MPNVGKVVCRATAVPRLVRPAGYQGHVLEASSVLHRQHATLATQGIRYHSPCNCYRTYATICSMSGINPAFTSQQLGHGALMLLSTYARWINSRSDRSELEILDPGIESVSTESGHL